MKLTFDIFHSVLWDGSLSQKRREEVFKYKSVRRLFHENQMLAIRGLCDATLVDDPYCHIKTYLEDCTHVVEK